MRGPAMCESWRTALSGRWHWHRSTRSRWATFPRKCAPTGARTSCWQATTRPCSWRSTKWIAATSHASSSPWQVTRALQRGSSTSSARHCTACYGGGGWSPVDRRPEMQRVAELLARVMDQTPAIALAFDPAGKNKGSGKAPQGVEQERLVENMDPESERLRLHLGFGERSHENRRR